MARITVEDCLEQIPNRFQLVLAATYRARMLSQGHTPKIESKNKPGVTALREIAAGKVGLEMLKKVPLTSNAGKSAKPGSPVAAVNAAAASFAGLTAKLDYLSSSDVEHVRLAYRFADEAHLGQLRNN
eukprot:gene34891-biopygen26033